MTLPRACLGCGRSTRNGPRCTTCARAHDRATWAKRGKSERYRTGGWEQRSKALRAQHVALYGPLCPGWQRGAHYVRPDQLVVDHDVGVMCRACNSRKAATVDKTRKISDGASGQHPRPARKPVTHRSGEPPGVA
jgi:hypothetical protein